MNAETIIRNLYELWAREHGVEMEISIEKQ